MRPLQIGIIREGKTPPDSRVPLTPEQCAYVLDKYPVQISVQPSPGRCFTDEQYRDQGIALGEELQGCDVLLGVKEVPIDQLIPDKTYFFFSHTIKEQPYNRKLLQAILANNIRLIDYEVLTNAEGKRLIAFGKFAGMVGAHNGIMTYGRRTGAYTLGRMHEMYDYNEALAAYEQLELPAMKIVVSGGGRVAKGAIKVLKDMGIKEVSKRDFLSQEYDRAVFTQLLPKDYVKRKGGGDFVKREFYRDPKSYETAFEPYTRVADVFINGIYWDNDAPAFFTREQMQRDNFNIQVVADVTCDIAPVSSIPSTLYASTIADPVFGYDPATHEATDAYQSHTIDMMTVDNLPNELPRDASRAFGEQFIAYILPELLRDHSDVIERAIVAEGGQLGKHFQYLEGYVAGE